MRKIKVAKAIIILIIIYVISIFLFFLIPKKPILTPIYELIETNVLPASTSTLITELNLPPEIKWKELYYEIENILEDAQEKYAVWIEYLHTSESISINSDTIFKPASIYKVPLAVLVMQKIDQGELTLETELFLSEKDHQYEFDALAKRGENYNISVDELLYYLIRYSDNTAVNVLERALGGYYTGIELMKSELGVTTFTKDPQEVTAEDIAIIFRGIYKKEYLSKESNDYLFDHLTNVMHWHNDRIAAGVPEGISVAHKIGNLDGIYQDAGIVFGEQRDFIIVVLNENVNGVNAKEIIQKITEITYNYLN